MTPFALLLGPDERVQAKALLSGEQRVRDFLNVTQRLVLGEAVAEAPVLAGASGPLEL